VPEENKNKTLAMPFLCKNILQVFFSSNFLDLKESSQL